MKKDVRIAVREHAPLSVDVSELLRHPGSSKRLDFRYEMEGLALPLAHVRQGSELDLHLRLDALVDGIHVGGTVDGEVVLECRRCLTDFEQAVSVPVQEVYLYRGEAAEGETYQIEADETVDLEPMIRDAVVLALPLHPLCREDCAGLCATCGADRNVVDCGHSAEPVDVRWGPLERLRDEMEG